MYSLICEDCTSTDILKYVSAAFLEASFVEYIMSLLKCEAKNAFSTVLNLFQLFLTIHMYKSYNGNMCVLFGPRGCLL
jgi:hypothetical protein